MDIDRVNVIGGIVAIGALVLCNLIFIFRLSGQPIVEHWLGIAFLLIAIPLFYLLFTAGGLQRPAIYSVQILVMISFIIVELLLDYIFKVEFRTIRWMTILYVMIFFAGTGGMIGIASLAGKIWTATAVLLFLTMTILAFWQRAKPGCNKSNCYAD